MLVSHVFGTCLDDTIGVICPSNINELDEFYCVEIVVYGVCGCDVGELIDLRRDQENNVNLCTDITTDEFQAAFSGW